MYLGTILLASFSSATGYFLGTRKLLFSVLLFLVGFCVLFTFNMGLLFGAELLTVILHSNV